MAQKITADAITGTSADSLFGSGSNTYANVFTYMGLPLSRDLDDQVDAVVMGVPYDLATSGRSGARLGPTAIPDRPEAGQTVPRC